MSGAAAPVTASIKKPKALLPWAESTLSEGGGDKLPRATFLSLDEDQSSSRHAASQHEIGSIGVN
jgi:hypothetical protein